MGVCTRYPKAHIKKEATIPGFPHLGVYFTVWSGEVPNGLLAMGDDETDAWVHAYQAIVAREGRCP